MKTTTVPYSAATSSRALVLLSVAGSRNSAAGVSRTTWVAVVAISHLLVPQYMLTTACRGTVSTRQSRRFGHTSAVFGLVVCTENLSSGVVVVKSAKDGV